MPVLLSVLEADDDEAADCSDALAAEGDAEALGCALL